MRRIRGLFLSSRPAPEDHPELDWETHVAESLLSGPSRRAPSTFDEVPSGEVAAEPAVEEAAPMFERVENPREYKALTQRDRWFGGRSDPERFEEALSFFAGHGWVVRSMVAGAIAGFSGNREELVVLLERGSFAGRRGAITPPARAPR